MKKNEVISKIKKLKNNVLNLIMEEEDEIKDDGLDGYGDFKDDKVEDLIEETISYDEYKVDKENKAKNLRDILKSKPKTLEEDLFRDEDESDKKIMEFVKESPYPVLEIVDLDSKNSPSLNSEFAYEKAHSVEEDVVEELTDEQEEEKRFYTILNAAELAIESLRKQYIFRDIEEDIFLDGFKETFYTLIESIDDNLALEKREKICKMNEMKDAVYAIDIEDEGSIYDCFNIIRQELHKVSNELGEYNEYIANSEDINDSCVLEYKIADMYENKETRALLLDTDAKKFAELMSLTEKMMYKIQDNVWINSCPEKTDKFMLEYNKMLWGSNTVSDVLLGIETLKMDIEDITNNTGRFTRSALA